MIGYVEQKRWAVTGSSPKTAGSQSVKHVAARMTILIKAGLHGQFYLPAPAPCLPSTADAVSAVNGRQKRRCVYTTDM